MLARLLFLLLVLCAVSFAGAQPPPAEVGRLLLAATQGISYRVSSIIGGIAQDGPDSITQQALEDAPTGGTFADPLTGDRLAIFSHMTFECDGRGSCRRENAATIFRSPADATVSVTIWTPEAYMEVSNIGTSVGQLYRLTLLDAPQQLAARQRGNATYEEDRANLSYVTMLRYVAQLLGGLPDVHSKPRSQDLIEFTSAAFGLTAVIDVARTRLINATFVTPEAGGTFTRNIEYGDWYDANAIGFSHPGWERVLATRKGEHSTPTLTIYQRPIRIDFSDPERFSWKPLAQSMRVVNDGSLLKADGTSEAPQAPAASAPPVGPTVEVSPQGLLRVKDPATPNRYVWAVGITLIAAGAALWIRNRFMTRK